MQTKVPIIGENLVASIMRHNVSFLTLDFMKFASIYFFCVLMILELLLFWFLSLKETEWRAFESWGGGGGGGGGGGAFDLCYKAPTQVIKDLMNFWMSQTILAII